MESFEFYASVRRHVRSSAIADLFCGHGLVGALFALAGAEVLLVDRRAPIERSTLPSHVAAMWP